MLEGFSFKPLEPGAATDGGEAGLVRAELLERFIAKLIDALIVGAFFAFPSFVGVLAGALYILISGDIRRSIARNAEFGVLILIYVILGWVPYIGKLLVGLAAIALTVVEVGGIITDEAGGARLGDRVAGTMVVADAGQTEGPY
ncbi:MAG: hypothetical protein HZB85_07070 [Deltaproteobacteria bacterium]|nr:hypothetical protein [Deltaproteobacteria bacterium]